MAQETSNPAAASKLGKYELLQEFAGSGVASTWIARSPDEPGLFSILRLHQHIAKKVEVAEEFLREARQIRAFRHRNVISLLETGVGDGEVFVVSEYVEGESLATLLAQVRADGLPLAVTLRIGLDLLEGLAAAHGQKPEPIVHGELNPYHVVVGTDGVTRISSFGVARALAKIGTHGVMRPDRLSYAAPERVRAMAAAASATAAEGPVDPRSDLFSAAVILWECIAKQRLFASKMESAVIQKVLSAPVPSLSSLPDVTVPEDVGEIIQKALERDLARRCPSADEFIMSLEGAGPDVIASQEQVAALVDKLAGKQIAARRKEIEEGGTAKKLSDRVGPAAPSLRSRLPTVIGMAPLSSSKPAMPSPKPAKPDPLLKPAAPRQGGASPLPPPVKEAAAKEAAAKEAPAKEAAAKEAPAKEAPSAVQASPSAAGAAAPEPRPPPRAAVRPPANVGASRTPLGPPVVPGKPSPKLPGGVNVRRPSAPPPLAAPRQAAGPLKVPPPAKLPTPPAGLAKPNLPPPPPKLSADKASSESPAPSATPPAPPDVLPVAALHSPAAPPVEIHAAADKNRLESIPPTKILEPAAPVAAEASTEEGSGPSQSAPASLTRGPASLALEHVRPFSTLGRYEILMPVAKGGMAVVWAARLQGTRGFQKIIAIKTMLPDVSDDPDFESMFLDEARVAARIRHPNVVEILDLGEENDVIYIAMEWIEGTTLSALIKAAKSTGGIPLPLAIRIASQICAGLHGAHELRDDRGALVDLVHRDVSPVNILISTTGFAKVADFGVAKSTARQHVTRAGGIVKGKTPYLSPEQFEGRALDRRSDLFSLGVLLYVMITGLHPFRAETDIKTLENISLKDPKPLREIVPSLNPEVERIVLKALEKDPEKRFSTAAEMRRALELLAPSLGPVTTNDDVAEFVRKTIGDVLEKNAAQLRQAIVVADGGTPEAHVPPPPPVPVAVARVSEGATDAGPESAVPVSLVPASEVPVSLEGDLAEEVRFDDDAPEDASKPAAAPEKKTADAPAPPGDGDSEKVPAARKPGEESPQATKPPAPAAAARVNDARDADHDAASPGGLMATIKTNRTAQLLVAGVAAVAALVLWLSVGGKEPAGQTGEPPTRQGAPSENVVAVPQQPPPRQPEPPPAVTAAVEAQPAAPVPEPASSTAPPPVIAAVEPISPPAATPATKAKSPTTSAASRPPSKPAAPAISKPPAKPPVKPGTKKFVPKGI